MLYNNYRNQGGIFIVIHPWNLDVLQEDLLFKAVGICHGQHQDTKLDKQIT